MDRIVIVEDDPAILRRVSTPDRAAADDLTVVVATGAEPVRRGVE